MVFLILLVSFITIVITLWTIRARNLSIVRASSLITLVLGGTFYYLDPLIALDLSMYLKVVFGASFLAMTTFEIKNNWFWIYSVVIYTLVFTFFFPHLPYDGGALGLCAFLSICLARLLSRLNFWR